MEEQIKRQTIGLQTKIASQFFEGILVIIPIGIAIWVLFWIFETVDGFLQPVIRELWGRNIPGVGFATTLILIYLTGALADWVIGKRFILLVESGLSRIPVFRYVYTGVKNLVTGFTTSGKSGGFSQVVLIEFPAKGMKTLAFITGEIKSGDEKLLTVYVPQSPTPTTGFIEIVKEEDVVRLDMSMEDAIKMVVSAGAFSPAEFKTKLKDVQGSGTIKS